ncbi:hypothetical protein MK805_03140 [Shimazuella sp. AN120528]|nr:hypothetical protein [Shimazuella soli]
MSRENEEFSEIFREINRKFRYFTANYTTAVKNGADIAKQKIMESVKNRDQPVDILLEKLFEAIKTGVQYAGERMIDCGVDMVEQMKKNKKK